LCCKNAIFAGGNTNQLFLSFMSKESVEELLIKGGSDKEYRVKYDNALSKEAFVEAALADGYDFTVEELTAVLRENGDMFESYGNPPKKSIWLK
jgi:hypothetical protein